MENSNINCSCPISKTRLYTSGNNDLIYVKSYKGDWGDWDEQPICEVTNTEDFSQTAADDDDVINDNFF